MRNIVHFLWSSKFFFCFFEPQIITSKKWDKWNNEKQEKENVCLNNKTKRTRKIRTSDFEIYLMVRALVEHLTNTPRRQPTSLPPLNICWRLLVLLVLNKSSFIYPDLQSQVSQKKNRVLIVVCRNFSSLFFLAFSLSLLAYVSNFKPFL